MLGGSLGRPPGRESGLANPPLRVLVGPHHGGEPGPPAQHQRHRQQEDQRSGRHHHDLPAPEPAERREGDRRREVAQEPARRLLSGRQPAEPGRGVERHPSDAGKEDLDPGVGVAGLHRERPGEGVVPPGRVANRQAGRNALLPQHHRQRGGELLRTPRGR